jgi:hypothetical protein
MAGLRSCLIQRTLFCYGWTERITPFCELAYVLTEKVINKNNKKANADFLKRLFDYMQKYFLKKSRLLFSTVHKCNLKLSTSAPLTGQWQSGCDIWLPCTLSLVGIGSSLVDIVLYNAKSRVWRRTCANQNPLESGSCGAICNDLLTASFHLSCRACQEISGMCRLDSVSISRPRYGKANTIDGLGNGCAGNWGATRDSR